MAIYNILIRTRKRFLSMFDYFVYALQIQSRVREATVKYSKDQYIGTVVGGNVPVHQCTFTHYRQLYLFPKYNGGSFTKRGLR